MIGDLMKAFEELSGTFDKLPKFLPIVARLDGKAFHTFTRGLKRPFDERLHDCFCATVEALIHEFDPIFGYTQSDEISLVFPAITNTTSIVFDGRKSKMISVLASFTTLKFNYSKATFIPEKRDNDALFDCRVFAVPMQYLKDAIRWRQDDCKKNSISMLAQHHFSHTELHGIHCDKMKEMLDGIGVKYDNTPNWFRYGTSFMNRVIKRKFSCDELEKLPEKHHARMNPDLEFERRSLSIKSCPIDDFFGESEACPL